MENENTRNFFNVFSCSFFLALAPKNHFLTRTLGSKENRSHTNSHLRFRFILCAAQLFHADIFGQFPHFSFTFYQYLTSRRP